MNLTRQIKLEGEGIEEWNSIKRQTDTLIRTHPDFAIKIIVTLTSRQEEESKIQEVVDKRQLDFFISTIPI